MENNNKKEIEKQLKELSKTHGEDVRVSHEVQRNGRIKRVSSESSHNIVYHDIHGNKIDTSK